jgi:hypothetical protein
MDEGIAPSTHPSKTPLQIVQDRQCARSISIAHYPALSYNGRGNAILSHGWHDWRAIIAKPNERYSPRKNRKSKYKNRKSKYKNRKSKYKNRKSKYKNRKPKYEKQPPKQPYSSALSSLLVRLPVLVPALGVYVVY